MTDLLVPHTCTNYRDEWGDMITSDVYNVAERLRELSPNLILRRRRDDWAGRPYYYVVSEIAVNGKEMWVFGVKHPELDARIIQHCQYLLGVPFEHRFAEAEKEADKYQADQEENERDKLVETMGLPMIPLLHQTGFIQRRSHYRNMNPTARRSRAQHAMMQTAPGKLVFPKPAPRGKLVMP